MKVVFDISSDEEPALDSAAGSDDYSWITKLLSDDADESDDVIVTGETITSKSVKVTAGNTEEDDDCVVLDGDPDKVVAVDDDKVDDGDDLVIVSQKGQIACRDYPHPRHLCAKFIFSSTPHETRCDLCHCYVCEIPAPCAHWGTGDSIIDHCHATEKDEFWKSQRKTIRLGKDAPLTVRVPDTSLSMPLPQVNLAPARDIIRTTQNQVSRPAVIRGCSSPRLTSPNMISPFRSRKSRPVFSRHRFPTHSGQQLQMLRVRNSGARNPGMFRRPGIISGGGSQVTQFVCDSSNNIKSAYGSECSQNAASWDDLIDVPWVTNMNHDSFPYQSTSETGMGNVFMSTVPSQSQVYSQPLPQREIYSHPMDLQSVYSQPEPEPQQYSQPIPEPQIYTQHSPLSIEGQNINELGNQMQNFAGPDFSEFDEWVSKTSQSNQQSEAENCQIPRTACVNELLPVVEDFNSQRNGSAKLPYNNGGVENWYQESQSGQMWEGYVPDLDDVTSDPAAFDAGFAAGSSQKKLKNIRFCRLGNTLLEDLL